MFPGASRSIFVPRAGKWLSLVAAALVCLPVAGASAADQPAKAADDNKIPLPQQATQATRDGVRLSLTYYPGTKGKESIPVVMLHMWKRSGVDYVPLARYLQETRGCAVVIPDLRGHGGSTTVQAGARTETLDAASMPQKHFLAMGVEDVLAIKNFLWEKNNAGELNLDRLCLVGAEMGASVATEWAFLDAAGYEWGRPYYGPVKLGRFVKALVLLSPEQNFRGLNTQRTLASPVLANPAVQSELAVMILVGKGDTKAVSDASRINNLLERYHPDPPPGPNQTAEKTLLLGRLDTSLQGTKLLEVKTLKTDATIGWFIDNRLINDTKAKTWTWKDLKRPHEG